MGRRSRPDPQTVLTAYNASHNMRSLCAGLGLNPTSDTTAKRICAEHNLPVPPVHWSARPAFDDLSGEAAPPVESPEDEHVHDRAVQRLKDEIGALKAKYSAAVKDNNAAEDLVNVLADEYAKPRPSVRMRPHRVSSTALPKREVIMQISDWQLGEKVIADESGGNVYDDAVAQVRLDRWQDKVIRSVRNQSRAYAIEYASFAFCGDIVEGHDIYSGQPWALSMDAGRQVVEGSAWFAAAIESVVTSLPDIEFSVYCVTGNHGKPGGRKAGHLPPTLNFDWMLYKWLERECANLPIKEFAIEPGGRLLFWQAGHVFLMTHGDEVRGWGGFPLYGLDKAHGRLVVDLETVFKYWLLGHWHQSATLPAGRGARIANGNAVGPNQLSQSAVMGSATPEQNLLFISDSLGLAEHAHIHLAPNEFVRPHVYGREPS